MIGLGIRCNPFNEECMFLVQILSTVDLEWCNCTENATSSGTLAKRRSLCQVIFTLQFQNLT